MSINPILSIIVPVFNVEKYLARCIDSILGQSFIDFELLLVDDGSTDGSRDIYEEYVPRDTRIRVYHKANGGVSSARNMGLSVAQGEYVVFVDADDIIPNDCLANHIRHLSEDIDITVGGMSFFVDESVPLFTMSPDRSEKKSISESLWDFTPNGDMRDWQRYMVNRMMRMSIIKENNIRFNEKIAYKEDGLFLVQYLLKCKGQVAYFPDIVYYYRQNPSSAMGALNSGRIQKLVTNIDAHALIIKEMRAADVSGDILGREIRHAFQSRRWVLDKLYSSKYYHKAWLRTLFKLLLAVGFATSVKIVAEGIGRKTKNILLQNKR